MIKTVSNVSAELTSLLTLSREDLNLNTFVFLSRGLMVNYNHQPEKKNRLSGEAGWKL